MDRLEYDRIENYMLSHMKDSAHDPFHIYRVLYMALDIAKTAGNIDMDVLLAACLLHDIGREQQFENLSLCHAEIGGEMAYGYLMQNNWDSVKAGHVRDCIRTHRYRNDSEPASMEARILFDADKLDVSGAIGIARTLIYSGQISEPLYILDEGGDICTEGGGEEISSFIQEYNYKLKNINNAFYTEHAKRIAAERTKAASDFYTGLLHEVGETHKTGVLNLQKALS